MSEPKNINSSNDNVLIIEPSSNTSIDLFAGIALSSIKLTEGI